MTRVVTWNDVAATLPDFVEWVVTTHGPLPEGPVDEDHYNRLITEYNEEH